MANYWQPGVEASTSTPETPAAGTSEPPESRSAVNNTSMVASHMTPATPMTPASSLPNRMIRVGHVPVEDLRVVDNRCFYRHGVPNNPQTTQSTPSNAATPTTATAPSILQTRGAPNTPVIQSVPNHSTISYPHQTLSQTPNQRSMQTISPEIDVVQQGNPSLFVVYI